MGQLACAVAGVADEVRAVLAPCEACFSEYLLAEARPVTRDDIQRDRVSPRDLGLKTRRSRGRVDLVVDRPSRPPRKPSRTSHARFAGVFRLCVWEGRFRAVFAQARTPKTPVVTGDSGVLETLVESLPSGDGGNRTHVRGRVKGGVYERIRRSGLAPRSPRRRGCGEPASCDFPVSAEAGLPR